MAPFPKRPRTTFGRRSRSSRAPSISTLPGRPSSAPTKSPSLERGSRGRSNLGLEDNQQCLLRVCCEPGSDVLDELETFASAYLKQRFRPSIAQAVATASYELCSNAISYASVATDVIFEIWSSASAIEVVVQNEAVPARVDVLQQMATRIRANPEEAYLEELRRSMAGKMPRAMLGLARVVHEAAMDLDIQVDGRRVKVTASCAR